MKRISSLLVPALLLATTGSLSAQENSPTAAQIIERIKKNVGVPWKTPTVDTVKAGDPNTRVTGVACTMMATFDVLQRAAAAGDNLVITHEPTFYSHLDKVDKFEASNDPVWAAKEAFIKEHHMVVWRFHDHWHAHRPDGILTGMMKKLGWQGYQAADKPYLFAMPAITVNDLAADARAKLGIRVVRIVGDPGLKVSRVAFIPGASGPDMHIKALQQKDVQLLVIGEVPEWETIEYVADAAAEGKGKALILLGHIPSEQAGMDECAAWLKGFVNEVPVQFIPAREPFTEPK
jgi:putative NIF3 family GTP cyclohydrolase 1 type 2